MGEQDKISSHTSYEKIDNRREKKYGKKCTVRNDPVWRYKP